MPFERKKKSLTGGGELGLELVITAELSVNHRGDLASGNTATVGLHAFPVKFMVPTLGSIVEKTLVVS